MLVALLDAEFTLKGYETVEGDGSPSQYRIPFPGGCDLPPGKYRWDHDRGAFLPTRNGPEESVQRPNVLKAIARGFMAVRDGKPLPKATLDWLKDYEQSMDNKD
jgi:hypothetical protein